MAKEIDQCLDGARSSDDRIAISCLNSLGDILEFHNLTVDDTEYIAETLIECIISNHNNKVRMEMFNVLEKTFKNLSVDPDVDRLVDCFDHEDDSFIANTLLLFPLKGSWSYISIAEKYLDHPNTFIARNAAYALKYLKG